MTVTLLHIFTFKGTAAKWWAFKQMPAAAGLLKNSKGLQFAKQLGSGAGEGFSLWPDFSTYVNITTWQSQATAKQFIDENKFLQELKEKSQSFTAVEMKALASKGKWNGLNPFENQGGNSNPKLLGVITRASIKTRLLPKFWANVPAVSRSMYGAPGKLYSKGIGERPLVEQATFSIWDSAKAMQHFAYQKKEHLEAVRKTRQLQWYSEELFARFEITKITGAKLF